MVKIVKGDEYILPIKILQGETVLTPSLVDDVRIQVGSLLKTYSESELTFNTSTNEWQYPLTQEQTFEFSDSRVNLQVGVKMDDDISYSVMSNISVADNIIKKEW